MLAIGYHRLLSIGAILLGLLATGFSSAAAVDDQALSIGLISAQEPEPKVVSSTVINASSDPMGQRLMELKNFKEAAEHYRLTLASDPNNLQACVGLSSALWKLGKKAEAKQSFSSCMSHMPDKPELYIARGLCEQDEGEQGRLLAESDYKKALLLDPQNPSAHNQLGILYQARGDCQAAILEFRAAIAADPNMPVAYNNLAACLIATQKYREAVSMLQQAIAMQPSLKGVYLYTNLGIAFLLAGKPDQAEAAFLMETAINPEHTEAHLNLANIYTLSKRYPEAVYEYERVLMSDPNHREALINLGAAYIMLGSPRHAMPYLQKAVQSYPDSPLAHHYLALACQATGDGKCYQEHEKRASELGYKPQSSSPQNSGN